MKRLGMFYREQVLTLPLEDVKEVPLPRRTEFDTPVSITNTLFGYRVDTDNDFIEVDTEAEARYLKIFIESGMQAVMIPLDKQYLEDLVPRLEKLKRIHDEVIGEKIQKLFSRRLQRQVHNEAWRRVMWEEPTL